MKSAIVQFIRRAAAFLTDVLFVRLVIRPELFSPVPAKDISASWQVALDLITILLSGAYVVGCHWRWGRTLGKRIVGLRVATMGGISPVPLRHAVLRFAPQFFFGNLSYAAGIFGLSFLVSPLGDRGEWAFSFSQVIGVCWLGADIAVALSTQGFRSLHDLVGDTVVTNEWFKKKEPNQPLEPTTMAVTPPAAQEPRQP